MRSIAISIRAETPTDIDGIRRVNVAAFGGSHEARIVDEVRGTGEWLDGGSIVAADQAASVVGHVLLSRGVVAGRDGKWLVGIIGPVAVMPASQRRGIGTLLMRAAIDRAVELELPVVCLLGHPDYYRRFGFEPARSIGIAPPQDWPDDAWLALRLAAWTSDISGVAHYPPAFQVG